MGETITNQEQPSNDADIIAFLTRKLGVENTRCALVLGPDFFSSDNTDLAGYIKYSSSIFYLPSDGLMYFGRDIKARQKDTQYDEIIRLLKSKNQADIADIYTDLARLPFSLVISLSPVDFLLDAYNNIGKKYYFYYYKNEFEIPTKLNGSYAAIKELDITEKGNEKNLITDRQMPLVLNMLGHYSDKQSLVYTHEALFEYLYSKPDTKIPDPIKYRIREEIECFVVLGVHFNRWYLKLIFFLLKKLTERELTKDSIKQAISQTAIFSYNDKDAAETAEISFYNTFFDIEFLKMNDKDFIKALLDSIPKDFLFKTVTTTTGDPAGNEFRTLLEQNRFDDALKKLRQFEADNNLEDSVTQLAGIWNSIKEQLKDGTVSPGDLELQKNNLRKKMQMAMQDDMDKIK